MTGAPRPIPQNESAQRPRRPDQVPRGDRIRLEENRGPIIVWRVNTFLNQLLTRILKVIGWIVTIFIGYFTLKLFVWLALRL